MRANPGPGKFIVIEGLDGAGTTTQADFLGERLAHLGSTWVTQEPTDRPAGQLIRRILARDLDVDPRALALLFAADRVDHAYHPEGILAHLQRGEHVLCDRYYLSSLAYQTLDAGFSWVYQINDRVLRPDLTVFVEVPVVYCLERIGDRQGEHKDLFEQQEALERVRDSYYQAIRKLGKNEAIQVVDGCGSIDQVADLIWNRVQALFDPSLITSPQDQRQLAQREQAPFLPALQGLLRERGDFFLRGIRQEQGRFIIEIDTPSSQEPLRLFFLRQAGDIAAMVPEGPHQQTLSELSRQALIDQA